MLYIAFIQPHIVYGLEVLGATCKTFINPILTLQKRMSRLITFSDYKHHSNPLFLELKLLDVFKEYRYKIGVFMHDLLNDNLPHKTDNYFSYTDHTCIIQEIEKKEISK